MPLINRHKEEITYQVGTLTVRPQNEALTIRFPGGGLVWNRPLRVTVEENGRVTRYPIPNLTRRILLLNILLSLLIVIFIFTRRDQ